MLRFKVFSNADDVAMEQEVNTWLLQAEPDVKTMRQSVGASGVLTVSFLYDAGFMANEQTMTAEVDAIVEHAQAEPMLEPIMVDQELLLPHAPRPEI